jgi:hypothetical protein
MVLKLIVPVCLLLGFAAPDVDRARATAQTPDIIALDGRQYPLLVNPLEPFFIQNPARRPRLEVRSSNNWRGYVAHFATVGNRLTLTDVKVAAGAGVLRSAMARTPQYGDILRRERVEQTTMDSAAVENFVYHYAAAESVLACGSAASAQDATILRLAPASGRLNAEFCCHPPNAVRELRDGRVLIVQTGAQPRLAVGDFRDGSVREIGRRGAGPGEWQLGGALLELGGDSTFMLAGMGRYLILHGDEVITDRSLTASLPASMLPLGADREGRIFTLSLRESAAHGGDSTEYALIDRRNNRYSPIAMLGGSHEEGFPPPAAGERRPTHPGRWDAAERPYYFPDGWLAVARLMPYRVDWRTPAGQWIRGAPIPTPVVRVDEREKQAYMDRAARRTGTAALPTSNFQVWPRTVPPFVDQTPLRGTADGKLVVQRAQTASQEDAVYDIVDRTGRLEGRLQLGPNQSILGFGSSSVSVGTIDANDIETITRHPWPARR